MTHLRLSTVLLLAACTGSGFQKDTAAAPDTDAPPVDADGDGAFTPDDCDDADPTAFPGAPEACDGADDDCDGTVDEDVPDAPTWYADADGDGYGAVDAPASACEAPAGYVADPTDCDDGAAAVHPTAAEVCDPDDVDEDCDGVADDGDPGGALDPTDWYADEDADGYGAGPGLAACEIPVGFVANAADCDDTAPAINPAAAEACGGADEDCDGAIDEPGAEGEVASYADADLDGFGDPATLALGCTVPEGALLDGTDCDDADATAYPGATELCDGRLNDCDDASATYEDGVVSYVDTSGAWSDVSASFAAATAASTYLDSGTYYFCAGTYHTKLVASSDTVVIEGIHGADVTTLENNGTTGAVVSATNGSVTLTGLTLTGGKGAAGYGGGLLVSWTSFTAPTAPHVVVDSCVVTANTASEGGGIALYGTSWAEIRGSVVDGNTASESGGGVYVDGGALLTIADTTIDGNTAVTGGGAFVDEGATLTLTDTWLTTNTAELGGGLYFYESDGTMACTTTGGVRENTGTTEGGGVYLNPKTGTTSFRATTCDFGSGATDNVTDDIGFIGAYASYDAGAAATFACVDTACTP